MSSWSFSNKLFLSKELRTWLTDILKGPIFQQSSFVIEPAGFLPVKSRSQALGFKNMHYETDQNIV
jgi:hypothetical protein